MIARLDVAIRLYGFFAVFVAWQMTVFCATVAAFAPVYAANAARATMISTPCRLMLPVPSSSSVTERSPFAGGTGAVPSRPYTAFTTDPVGITGSDETAGGGSRRGRRRRGGPGS